MLELFFGHKTRVLLVNGNRRESGLLSDFLPQGEFEVIKTGTARAGLKAAQKESPEIILLDSELPDGNSWATLSDLKADLRTSSIPVLMCTPMGDPVSYEKAHTMGAQGCIPKPLKKEVVMARVARRLNREAGKTPVFRKGSF